MPTDKSRAPVGVVPGRGVDTLGNRVIGDMGYAPSVGGVYAWAPELFQGEGIAANRRSANHVQLAGAVLTCAAVSAPAHVEV